MARGLAGDRGRGRWPVVGRRRREPATTQVVARRGAPQVVVLSRRRLSGGVGLDSPPAMAQPERLQLPVELPGAPPARGGPATCWQYPFHRRLIEL